MIQSTCTDLVAPPPTAAVVTRLAELYADDLDLLTRLSGLDVSGWPPDPPPANPSRGG
ncbi:uncharacterized protein PD653_4269 [Nocardioides sp. PD653]|nr:uncharacterized protein PD653B2_3955 [Nocardioides sp. PD653-B2]GAW56831.1 uncharacterized protein PD653_4269 [Nocardioides sp. PD653]